MAFTVGATAAKDGAATPAAIPGGLLSADVAGGGVGPTFFFHGLVDGVAGVNKGQITAANALKVDGSAVTQPVSLASTTVTGTVAVTESGTWTVQPGNTANTVPWLAKIHDGTTAALVKPASSGAAATTDTAIVVTLRDVNANGRALPASSAPVVLNSMTYKAVAASATATLFGATGASGDYLDGVLIVPATAAAGVVSITDGSGSPITIFAGGGTTALPTLAPFYAPVGAISSGGAGGWKVTTGTNVSVIGVGNFT